MQEKKSVMPVKKTPILVHELMHGMILWSWIHKPAKEKHMTNTRLPIVKHVHIQTYPYVCVERKLMYVT